MTQAPVWLTVGITVTLAAAFWLPYRWLETRPTPYAPLQGAVISLVKPQPAPASAQPPRAGSQTAGARRASRRFRSAAREPIAAAKPVEAPPAPPAEASGAIAAAPPPPQPATSASSRDMQLDDLAMRFEADPAKYPLDRRKTQGGITFSLAAIGREGSLFVLKVAVANDTDADFFIAGFTVQAGRSELAARSLFRILVEPRRTREGYVMFGRPSSQSAVKITLKEDGGRGSAVVMPIPYSF
ncbi:MAG: hypothetical protein PHF00_07200 [Elusimicrobia bacterium]|nr:hypothetical protein [Elusimicrobiota bacterium]